MNDYIFQTDRMFFKHEISENLPRDAYSMHIHSSYELIYFIDGNATHVIEDRKYKLKKGDLILIRPFQYHFIQIDATSRYERYDLLFDPEKHLIDALDLIPESAEVLSLEGNAAAQDVFRRCDLYHRSCPPEIFSRMLPHLISELFFNIRLFPQSFSGNTESFSPLISKALRYINENLCSITDVGEIASRLFVSESYLFRLFKKELHSTPKKYIREKRLLLAQKLLSSGEKPANVYEQCGFSDYTTFYRNYTAFFGRSPKETPIS